MRLKKKEFIFRVCSAALGFPGWPTGRSVFPGGAPLLEDSRKQERLLPSLSRNAPVFARSCLGRVAERLVFLRRFLFLRVGLPLSDPSHEMAYRHF